MSRLPNIPEFDDTVSSMATALRAVKNTLEIVAGLRQGEGLGAPQVYVQASEPTKLRTGNYKTGDIWINSSTDVMSYWNGSTWKAIA